MGNFHSSERQDTVQGDTSAQSKYNRQSGASLQNRMLEYLISNYADDNDTFTYFGLLSGDVSISGKPKSMAMIQVRSEKYPDAEVFVYAQVVDDEVVFSDNYMYYKYEKQIQAFISENLNSVFYCEYRLFICEPGLSHTRALPSSTSFEDFIFYETTLIKFTVITAPGYDAGERDFFQQKLNNAFKGRARAVIANIRFPDNTVDYNWVMSTANLYDIRLGKQAMYLSAFGLGREDVSFEWWR